MAMNVLQSPSRPGLGKVSGFFWRNPGLGLFLLLLGPLMWFGIVYFGSLLTLLWQGFYTFDDFTMSVTPELTLANIRALFNPANYDIILRTLTMAVAVTIASAILAFPMAWYMARYTSGKMKAFFYIAVMLPMWASYIVKAYAWTLLLAKDGVAQWFLQHLGLEPLLTAFLTLPAVGGNTLSTSGLGRFLVFLYIWLPFMILPVQAALERLPPSLLQASADLGARPRQTFRYVVLPLAIPGIAAGSIFTFSLTLGDFIVPQLVGPPGYFIGNMVYSQQGAIGNMPMAAAFTLVPIVLIALYLAFVKRLGALMHSERAPFFLKLAAWGGVVFLHFPILIIAAYAFNTEDAAFSFPPQGLTLRWFSVAAQRSDILDAVTLSLKVAALATLMALVLGTLAAAALWRRDFFGKNAISLLLLLPIALPGIVTGLALLTAFKTINLEPGFFTIVVGHATFCVVVVFNNVIARFRRTSWSLVEASMDLGANGWQTFRYVVLPNLSSALLAGGMLAFALSFDEIIVTTFTAGHERTLPLWLLNQLGRPRDVPVTNVVALLVMLVTTLPILGAWWLTREGDNGQ